MAARNLKEAIERVEIKMKVQRAICLGTEPLSLRIDKACNEIDQTIKGEIRDTLAHEVARHCARHNDMSRYDILTEFVNELIEGLSATKLEDGGNQS